MNDLIDYSTAELVEELALREGVQKEIAEPYEVKNFTVEGSAIILIVVD